MAKGTKISALGTATALTGTEEVVMVQGGVTTKSTAQDIADLGGGGGGGTLTTKGDLESFTTVQARLPVGTDDQVLTADSAAASGLGTSTLPVGNTITTLGGNAGTDCYTVEALDGSDVLKMCADGAVILPTGYIGVGTSLVGPGYGGHKFVVSNSTTSSGFKCTQSGANGKALELLLSASVGTQYGLYVTSTTSNVMVNASLFNITGTGTGAKNAINIVSGTIEMPAAGAVHGCQIGTASTQIMSFWGATPIDQPTALTAADATATDGTIGTADTIINNLRIRLDELEAKLSAAGGGSGLIA